MIRAFLSLLLVGVGVFLVCAAFVPKLRPHWKGTKVSSGVLGCIGFAAMTISGGITLLHSDLILPRFQDWLTWAFFGGWIVAIIGCILDIRRARRIDSAPGLQFHLISKKRGSHDA